MLNTPILSSTPETEIPETGTPDTGEYICSITGQIMAEPVVAADGHTYEREAIIEWLSENPRSPRTCEVMENKELRRNRDKEQAVDSFLAKHPALKSDMYLPKAWIRALVLDLKADCARKVMAWFSKDRRLLTRPLEGPYPAFHIAADFGSPELLEMVCEQLESQGSLEGITHKEAFIAYERETTISSIASRALARAKARAEKFKAPTRTESSQNQEPPAVSLPSPMEDEEARLPVDNARMLAEQAAGELAAKERLAAYLKEFKGTHLNTLLERALVQENEAKAARWLWLGADLEQPDQHGDSLLARCVCRGQLPAMQWLVAQGASLSSCNSDGNTPLHLSVLYNRVEIAAFLLSIQADRNVQNLEAHSAFHLAVLGQSTSMIAAFIDAEQAALSPYHIALLQEDQHLMGSLLDQNVPGIDDFDAQGRSPLWIASQRGNVSLVRSLFENGAELELACGIEEQRSLHIAAKEGHQEVVALLVAWKADVGAKDLKGNTPLHYAAKMGSEAVSACLLNTGTYRCYKAMNYEYQTPVQLAFQNRHFQVGNFIENKAHSLEKTELDTVMYELLQKVTQENQPRSIVVEQRLTMLEKQAQRVYELLQQITQENQPRNIAVERRLAILEQQVQRVTKLVDGLTQAATTHGLEAQPVPVQEAATQPAISPAAQQQWSMLESVENHYARIASIRLKLSISVEDYRKRRDNIIAELLPPQRKQVDELMEAATTLASVKAEILCRCVDNVLKGRDLFYALELQLPVQETAAHEAPIPPIDQQQQSPLESVETHYAELARISLKLDQLSIEKYRERRDNIIAELLPPITEKLETLKKETSNETTRAEIMSRCVDNVLNKRVPFHGLEARLPAQEAAAQPPILHQHQATLQKAAKRPAAETARAASPTRARP